MIWLVYLSAGLGLLLFAGIIGAFVVAGIMDWKYSRTNRLFIELRRDHTKRRRPLAK